MEDLLLRFDVTMMFVGFRNVGWEKYPNSIVSHGEYPNISLFSLQQLKLVFGQLQQFQKLRNLTTILKKLTRHAATLDKSPAAL